MAGLIGILAQTKSVNSMLKFSGLNKWFYWHFGLQPMCYNCGSLNVIVHGFEPQEEVECFDCKKTT